MELLPAIKDPRIYHRLIPNVVFYENWTVVSGEHIELSEEKKEFLKSRGHDTQDVPFLLIRGQDKLYAVAVCKYCDAMAENGNQYVLEDKHKLDSVAAGAYCNIVVQEGNEGRGMLTAVSDIRKGGYPAAL